MHDRLVAFVGPMRGNRGERVPTAAELLAMHLEDRGWSALTTSDRPSRFGRLLDMLSTVFRRRRDLDIVCLQVFGGPSAIPELAVSLLARLLRLPIVVVLRGGALPVFAARHPRVMTAIVRPAAAVVAPSRYLERELGHLAPITVIPNAVDIHALPYVPRAELRPRILWMRAFHVIYDPEQAVRVLASLLANLPDVRMTMAGPDAGGARATRELAESLGVAHAIAFTGMLDDDRKREALADHDLYLHTNRIDNLPVSVLEAAGSGIPIVATAVGGIPDLLTDGVDALLVTPGDVPASVSAIMALLGDEALACRLSTSGRELAERHDVGVISARFAALFDQIFAGTRKNVTSRPKVNRRRRYPRSS